MNYTGNQQPKKNSIANNNIELTPYIPDDELVEAVNLAITLQKPLLVTGEPGCGKTKLAYDVYHELNCYSNGKQFQKNSNVYIYEYRTHSESTLKDAIYRYDALKRLHDIEEANTRKELPENDKVEELLNRINQQVSTLVKYVKKNKNTSGKKFIDYVEELKENVEKFKNKYEKLDIKNYIDMNELGKALNKDKRSNDSDKPSIVLIDEIENAPSEFLKDLMRLLDVGQYVIKETGETLYAKNLIFFITCNEEKELSDAFLRRCLFFHIKFPDDSMLMKILKAHFEDKYSKTVFEKASELFKKYRNNYEWIKKPSVSELKDWFNRLKDKYKTDEEMKKVLTEKLKNNLIEEGLILCKTIDDFKMISTEKM